MNNIISSNAFNGIYSAQMDPELEPMRTGKAAGWGVFNYHWVQLPVTDDNKYLDTTTPAIEWCKDHYGKSGTRWFEKKKKFYFKDEKDMTMFILRWS